MSYLIVLLLVSVLPGLLWLVYFYRQDRFNPEPKSLVLKVFLAGMAMVVPAGLLEMLWQNPLREARITGSILALLVMAFLVIGIIEEGVKMLLLYVTVYPSPELNEPVDGIVYGITVGLGFAVLENLLYTYTMGYRVGLVRAVIGCLAHAAFTGWGGWYLWQAKKSAKPVKMLLKGLMIAVFWHGLYNFLLFLEEPILSLVAFFAVGALIIRLLDKMRLLVQPSSS